MIDHVWEGVYERFGDVPASGPGFDGDTWSSRSRAKIKAALETARSGGTVTAALSYGSGLLPVVAALSTENRSEISILDFGGGLGFDFVSVAQGVVESGGVAYHVVDNATICALGSDMFRDDSRISFHDSLPDEIDDVDIVHLGSSLHYVDDWRSVLARLAGYRPHYFVLTDLPAGDIPTYATAQNYYESKIPCWFFDVHQILDQMASLSFKLLLKSRYVEHRQDNFPDKFRLGHSCNLLFAADAESSRARDDVRMSAAI